MTSGGETPGIGAPGIAKPATRAPKAWQGMAREALVNLPLRLSRSQQNRRRLLRVR